MGTLLGLEQAMTMTAQILRDQASKDALGAKASVDWQPLGSPVPCLLWWGTGRVLSRAGSVHEHPEETVDIDNGGLIVPAGTDITARDRIGQVLAGDGSVITPGPLLVLAVLSYEGITEVGFRRTH